MYTFTNQVKSPFQKQPNYLFKFCIQLGFVVKILSKPWYRFCSVHKVILGLISLFNFKSYLQYLRRTVRFIFNLFFISNVTRHLWIKLNYDVFQDASYRWICETLLQPDRLCVKDYVIDTKLYKAVSKPIKYRNRQ